MSVDILQEKIRKLKNPSVLELNLRPSQLPKHILEAGSSAAGAYGSFCRELLVAMKGVVPGVRVSFSSFALLGPEGLEQMIQVLKFAKEQGFYVLLDAPEILSPDGAAAAAVRIFGEDSLYFCDGLVISGYAGSDCIRPFLPYCKEKKKDIFVVARTANKSAPELQDLLSGSRLVHAAAADHVNRYGEDTVGKFGYTRVGILAAASASDSLRNLRGKYPKLFMLLDGLDYPGSSFPKCVPAFDQYGHGAVICVGDSVTCAWKQAESDGVDFVEQAQRSAERMKKNLSRYITIL